MINNLMMSLSSQYPEYQISERMSNVVLRTYELMDRQYMRYGQQDLDILKAMLYYMCYKEELGIPGAIDDLAFALFSGQPIQVLRSQHPTPVAGEPGCIDFSAFKHHFFYFDDGQNVPFKLADAEKLKNLWKTVFENALYILFSDSLVHVSTDDFKLTRIFLVDQLEHSVNEKWDGIRLDKRTKSYRYALKETELKDLYRKI